eukprot:1351202-Lingulodinium_polyedra.AAC.2
MATKFPKFSQALAQDPATRRIWYGIATAHDFESHDDMTEENLYQKIFASHFGHLAIIFLWTSGNLFHVAWQGNFEQWILNPLKTKPIAHMIWDPHFGEPALKAFTKAGHLVHVAIPEARGVDVNWGNFLTTLPHPDGLTPFFSGNWSSYASNPDTASHIFGTSEGAGTAILTFLGGFHPQTQALWLTDIAHHHLAIGVVFVVAGHMYRTNFGIGHSLKEILEAHRPPGGRLGAGHRGLFETITNSLHMQLGLALASLGVATSLVAQHMYALPAYAFISKDFTTQAALYTHHQYIAGFLMVGAFAHGAIFFVRDYDPELNKDNVLALVAFGQPEKQILVEPVFAQFIQASSGKLLYGFNVLLASDTNPASVASSEIWLPGWLNAINDDKNSLFLTIGPGDFLVHHAIALGLHTTTLILVKGALDARGSKLMPDKKDFGYSFPCDGPGRGGTCDISAWDAFYLSVFWMLNTIGWVTFYWHWKHITLWQ